MLRVALELSTTAEDWWFTFYSKTDFVFICMPKLTSDEKFIIEINKFHDNEKI